jgi:hypothetical protein
MRGSCWLTRVLVAALIGSVACDDGGIRDPVDVGADGAPDTGGPDGAPDATEDAGDAEDETGPSFESLFVECEDATACSAANHLCHQGTCVRRPTVEAELWREESNDYVPVDGPPDFSCWVTPTELGENDPPVARIEGNVDLFGPSQATRNLCVTAYDEALLLHWLVWLDANVCGSLLNVDTRRQEPYVNCFALDPCRCNDAVFTGRRPPAGDSVEACYAEIGYCAGIEDAGLQARCRGNVLERTGLAADTLIYGFTVSQEYEPNPSRTEGVYGLGGVPTNTRMVMKVSGSMTRWRDTYEYGALIPADTVNESGVARFDVNVIGDGAWDTIPLSAGIPEPTPRQNVAIAGVVRDCSENNNQQVLGAQVGLTVDAVKIAYFNGSASDTLPSPGQGYTNRDGVYAAISAPAGPNRVSAAALQQGVVVSAGLRDIFATPYSVILATFEGSWE